MAKNKFLKAERLTEEVKQYLSQVRAEAAANGQTTAQRALSWVLEQKGVTSVLVGASNVSQLKDNIETVIK